MLLGQALVHGLDSAVLRQRDLKHRVVRRHAGRLIIITIVVFGQELDLNADQFLNVIVKALINLIINRNEVSVHHLGLGIIPLLLVFLEVIDELLPRPYLLLLVALLFCFDVVEIVDDVFLFVLGWLAVGLNLFWPHLALKALPPPLFDAVVELYCTDVVFHAGVESLNGVASIS